MNRILNNDVVNDIVIQLETKSLFRLMRVSKQFQESVDYALSLTRLLIVNKRFWYCSDGSHYKYEGYRANGIGPLFDSEYFNFSTIFQELFSRIFCKR